jgi:hypothetical protein
MLIDPSYDLRLITELMGRMRNASHDLPVEWATPVTLTTEDSYVKLQFGPSESDPQRCQVSCFFARGSVIVYLERKGLAKAEKVLKHDRRHDQFELTVRSMWALIHGYFSIRGNK